MAKITGYIGELSGKLGGMIFARNKGGAYVKAFATPTNPKTMAQAAARATFGASVGAWHSLDDTAKQGFNSFAANIFKPKYPIQGVLYSGFNSYVSLRNTLETARSKAMDISVTEFTITNTLPEVAVAAAPALAISGNITILNAGPTGGDIASSISLTTAELNISNNLIDFNLRLGVTPTIQNHPNFVDPTTGKKLGLLCSASLPMSQAQQFAQNPKYVTLAATKLIDVQTSTLTANNFDCTMDFVATNYKFLPAVGEFVKLTFFLYDEDGQTFNIGSFNAEVV